MLLVFTTLVYSWLVKVSTVVHLNCLYIAVLTPGAMSHMLSDWNGHGAVNIFTALVYSWLV